MTRKWLFGGGATIILVFAAVLVGQSLLKTRVISDNADIRFRSYRQIANALDVGESPERWDTAVFLAAGMASRAADALKGTVIPVGKPGENPYVVLVLQGVTLSWDVGVIRAKLDLTGVITASQTPFSVKADADFVIEAVEADPKQADGVLLLIEPRIYSLTPGLGNPFTMLKVNAAMSEIIALGIDTGLRKKLRQEVPIRRSFDYSTTIDQQKEVSVTDSTKLTLRIASPGEKLHTDIVYRSIVTPSGLWALGAVSAPGAADTQIDQAVSPTPSQTANLDSTRTVLAGRLKPYGARSTDFAVFLGASIFSKLATTFNSLNPANRAVSIRSTAISGPLFAKNFGDAIGSVSVTLQDTGAVSASVNTGRLLTSWDAQKATVSINLPVDVSASAGIRVEVKPPVIPPDGAPINMKGHLSATVAASAAVQRISLDAGPDAVALSGIFLVPDITCQGARLEVSADGPLVLGPLKTTVPPIGAAMSMTLGKEQTKPFPIITSLATVYAMAQPVSPVPGTTVSAPTPARGLRVGFSGFVVNPETRGVWIGANAAIAGVDIASHYPDALTQATAAQVADQAADHVKEQLAKTRPTCTLPSNIEMRVAGVAIGENNEFVKVTKDIIQAHIDAANAALDLAARLKQAAEQRQRDLDAAAAWIREHTGIPVPNFPHLPHW